MRSCAETKCVGGVVLALIAMLAVATAQMSATMPQKILGFEVPEYDEEGRLKTRIQGAEALLLTNGTIQVKDVRLEFYREGQLDVTMTAPLCLYDRRTNRAFSDSPVRIESAVATITGVGFRWSSAEANAVIEDQATVVLKNIKGWFARETTNNVP